MLVLPSAAKAALSGTPQPRTGTRPIRVKQALSARNSRSTQSSGLYHYDVSGHRSVSVGAAASKKTESSSSAQVAIDSPTSLRAFMQALQGKADSLRALAASFAPQAAAADAETLEKVQHAVKRLKAFVSIGHTLSESYVRRLGRSVNDTSALRALASHIVRIDVLASSVTAMKRSFECGGIEMGDQLSSLLDSVRKLRESATQAEQEAQYLQDNPEAAAQALKEDAESDAAAAANETNGTVATAKSTPAASSSGDAGPGAPHATSFGSSQQADPWETDQGSATEDLLSSEYDSAQSEYEGASGSEGPRAEDSDGSVGVYETSTDSEEEDLESVEGLHNSIQRQRSRLQTLMTRVESLQHLAANLEAQEDPKGKQNVEALRNAVVELAKLRQMVESDDAALESHDAALGAASELAAAGQGVSLSGMPPASRTLPPPDAMTPAPADGATVRKVPGLDAVGTGKPHVTRRRATVDMYASRHLRTQEENERPRHTDEVSKISERIMKESETLRQELQEREAKMEGRPPPTPRSREEVWASARRRRPTGDYGSRRTSEGSARENASAIRRRSSGARLVPPLAADAPPFGSGSQSQTSHAHGASSGREEEQPSGWEMFAQDGRSQDKSGKPFVRMRRRSSYEARRSIQSGDEENKRRRGSVDFSVRGNKAADSDWTSTDWNDTAAPKRDDGGDVGGTDWSAASSSGSPAVGSDDAEPAAESGDSGGLWGAAKRLFGVGGGSASSQRNKPFVRPKKSRPQHSTPPAPAARDDSSRPYQSRGVPESDSSSGSTEEDSFWGSSTPSAPRGQGGGESSGASPTPYVHKRKSVDYASRQGGTRSRSVPRRVSPARPDAGAASSSAGGEFWGSDATAAAGAGHGSGSRDEYSGSPRDQPKQQDTASSSAFWGSSDAAADASEQAGEALQTHAYSAPDSQPYVHRRRGTAEYSARRSRAASRGDIRRRSTSHASGAGAQSTAYSAASDGSDHQAGSGSAETERQVPRVRKNVPDYSARRGGGARDSGAARRRSSRTGAASSTYNGPTAGTTSSSFGQDTREADSSVAGANSASESQAEPSFFGTVDSLRDAIKERSRSHSERQAPRQRKEASYASRRSSAPRRGGGSERRRSAARSVPASAARPADNVTTGGTDWSSDSWTGPDAAGSASSASPLSAEPTPQPSAAVRRRKPVDYAARRSLSGDGGRSRAQRSSARAAPRSHRVDAPAYESESEHRGGNEGAGVNGAQMGASGGGPRGAARYARGNAGQGSSYDIRRSSAYRRSSVSTSRNFSRDGTSGSTSDYDANRMSGASSQNSYTQEREPADASPAPEESVSTWGGQGATDWGDSSRPGSNGAGGGKPYVRSKPASYSARRGGGDEENARRGRRRSLDARRR